MSKADILIGERISVRKFYERISGILGCVLCVLWFVFVFDTPHDARCISQQEIEHITANKKKSAKVSIEIYPKGFFESI